jgi:hypothetical protein
LARAIQFYGQRSLAIAGVIAELVGIAQQLSLKYNSGTELGLHHDKLAFTMR